MNKIKELRKAKGWTQRALAEKLGVERSTVTRWELGNTFPSKKYLIILAGTLGCSVDEILGV